MAETTNAATGSAAAARRPTAKRAPTKAAPKKTTPAPMEAANVTAFVCEPAGVTKRWAKFTFPEDSGCVGTIYAPLGTKVAKVRLES